MRISIRTRILSIFIGVTLIQTLLLGTFFLYQNHKTKTAYINQELTSLGENLNGRVSIFLHTIYQELKITSQQVERMAQKDYQRYNLLNTLKNGNPSFTAVVFYDMNGIIKTSVSNNTDQKTPTCFTNYPELFNNPYYSGKPYVSQLTTENNSLALGISQPVSFLDDSYVIGVISALISYDSLQQMVSATVLPSNTTILILDNNGNILAKNLPDEISAKTFLTDKQWDSSLIIDNTHYTSVSSSLDFLGQQLTIVSIIDVQKSWIPQTSPFVFLCILTILLIAISFFIGWTTNRKVIAPLELLATDPTTMLLRENNTITLPDDVEFHELATAMNSFNLQLRQSNESLKREIKKRRFEENIATIARLDAEKANQAKSIYLANMSHEIRTPLHGMVELLDMLGKDPLNDYQKQLLSMATLSGRQLQTVVSSILDYSQIESGKFELHRSPLTLSKLISEVIELLQLQTKKKGITINAEQAADIPNNLNGDSGRIRQILINLISNSIKFSDKGPIELKIELQSPVVESKIELLFTLKDHGFGISDDAKTTIFKAFNRGDVGVDQNITGTGLGLSISADFVQHMGGKLWLADSSKDGSTFCFTISCDVIEELSNQIPPEKKAAAKAKSLTGIHVFLAEDEYINQLVTTAYLEEQGATVTVCENGQNLLNTMDSATADIILMDIRMPVMNGLEATETIRRREKDNDQAPIPIVALTAQTSTDFENKCKKAGMDEYVTKPIPFEKLEKIIGKLVKK